MQTAFYFSDGLKSTVVKPSYFSNHLQPQNLLQSTPSPVGEGWGEGIHRMVAIFPSTSIFSIQALWLVALSLALSHGREDGVAVGIKGSARKIGFTGCFLLFRRPAINGKPKLPFKSPKFAKSAATCSLPRGGGLGRGYSPNCSNLSQHPNHPNTSLAACCPLSSSLPRGERTGGYWDEGFCKEIRSCRLLLLFRRPL